MLTGLNILIAEDQALLALDLAEAVEAAGGHVLGPAATVTDGLAIAEQDGIGGAILDANLLDRDVTPLALRLIERGIPFVLHTGTGLPSALAQACPQLTVVMKPVSTSIVIEALEREIAKRSNVPPRDTICIEGTPPAASD